MWKTDHPRIIGARIGLCGAIGSNGQTDSIVMQRSIDPADYESTTSGVNKNSAKYKRAKWMLDLWDTIRKAGNLSEDVGKNKNTGNFGKDGNNQEDEELKRLRKRIEL